MLDIQEAEEELKWCSYQVLNEILAPQLHRETSETRFLASDAQDSLAFCEGIEFVPKCL